jgi:hypothetical protein
VERVQNKLFATQLIGSGLLQACQLLLLLLLLQHPLMKPAKRGRRRKRCVAIVQPDLIDLEQT